MTVGGFGIWSLIDYLRISFGSLKDKQGRVLRGYTQHSNALKVVAIVLACISFLIIPGIILLTVFLAVPSLQANSRDTMRKNDLATIAGSLGSYAQSHHGSYPSKQDFSNGAFQLPNKLSILTPQSIQYAPTPTGCDAVYIPCTQFTLTTTLEKGGVYSLRQ